MSAYPSSSLCDVPRGALSLVGMLRDVPYQGTPSPLKRKLSGCLLQVWNTGRYIAKGSQMSHQMPASKYWSRGGRICPRDFSKIPTARNIRSFQLQRKFRMIAFFVLLEAAIGLSSSSAQQPDQGTIVPDIVLLPGGDVLTGDFSGSGDPDERPVHPSRIRQIGFGRTEITRRQWAPFAAERGYPLPDLSEEFEDLPVVNVDYDDAEEYARWLSSRTGDRWRLPTEAEWEYAARAGGWTLYQNGNDSESVCQVGNIADTTALDANPRWEITDCSDGFADIAPAESFAPNAFGLYDLHGNVWEWVDGCGGRYRRGGGVTSANCDNRGIRGGSYQTPAWFSRSSNRETLHEDTKRSDVGFRLVKE